MTKSSSVGLSLLLCFMRDAEAAEKSRSASVLFAEDMREIAEVSGSDRAVGASLIHIIREAPRQSPAMRGSQARGFFV